jgi:hypothetical protein
MSDRDTTPPAKAEADRRPDEPLDPASGRNPSSDQALGYAGLVIPEVSPALFASLVGRVVDVFAPCTEASPVAIALQFLVAMGNLMGLGPRFYVGETRHGLNENLMVVGRSSFSRKGDSWCGFSRGFPPGFSRAFPPGMSSCVTVSASGFGASWLLPVPLLRAACPASVSGACGRTRPRSRGRTRC